MEWTDVLDYVGEGFNRASEAANRGLLKLFGNSNERAVRRLRPRVAAINALEPKMQALSDGDLKGLTAAFRARIKAGETLDDLLVEAFAACRESGRRFMNMRHYDVQLMGGMVLHEGKIAEMVTGEGKTLVATLAAYLNALAGRGVHVVTVNDYLARRDSEWNSPLFHGLGVTVGAIQSSMDPNERQPIYACDITYGTNNEFGFDYLRDNMKPTRELQCQRELFFAIVDEVDSILIDEARTPLIIAGPALDDPTKYSKANRVALQLKRDVHFEVKEKEHTCHLTDEGVFEAEKLVGVESFYTAGNMEWPHLIDNALKANHLYRRDKDYMVRDGEVIIIDEHTGRPMEGRQWSDGLHQSVEAKEGVVIKEETQTLATITFQNFFKLYQKVGGMTGTAMTEANEFFKIYNLEVVAIPTNRPLVRENYPDVIYATAKEKWKSIVDEVKTVHKTGRPILIGTTSVEKSEYLSGIFGRSGIKHEVLNAKFIEREAEIVAQAGRRNAVTIATNMAGRGTDIILGGNPEHMAWSALKHQYATRLDVPPDVWRQTVEPFEGPMKEEGRQLIKPVSTAELARQAKIPDADKLAEIVDAAPARRLDDPERIARDHKGIDLSALIEVIKLRKAAHPGGLHIIGTERHDSRRIDNQLRGRSGRQGDPGSSRFYLSLEDDLMRIFAGDWVKGLLQRMGMVDGEAIESRMVSRRIEGAQKKVEERYFESRKSLLEYDEIMDVQRKQVYGFRQDILDGADCKRLLLEMIAHRIEHSTHSFMDPDYGTASFAAWLARIFGLEFEAKEFRRCDFTEGERIAREEAKEQIESAIGDVMDENLPDEADPSEWNWEALAQWVNARWGNILDLNIKSYDIKKLGREGVEAKLFEWGRKVVDKVSLEGGEQFFDPDFGIKNLVGWTNHHFGTNLTIEQFSEERHDNDRLIESLNDAVRRHYEEKELTFPVRCGITRFLADKTNNINVRYDRDGLVAWANSRFDASLSVEKFSNLSRTQVEEQLLDINRRFLDSELAPDRIDELVDDLIKGADDSLLSDEQIEEVSRWASGRFGSAIEFPTPRVTAKEARRAIRKLSEAKFRPELAEAERTILLQFLDSGWKDHLYAMDHLRSGIGLVGYAQIDPKVEYKRKGKVLFTEMWDSFEDRVTELVFRVEEVDPAFVSHLWRITNTVHDQAVPGVPAPAPSPSPSAENRSDIRQQQDAAIDMSKGEQKTAPIRNRDKKVGRNDPCPCGSGKKYKNCCMNKRQAG